MTSRAHKYYFEVYRDTRGEFRWRLWAPNGRIMADSGEGYRTQAACRRALARLKEVAADARVERIKMNGR
jgi:uncharacterized protein